MARTTVTRPKQAASARTLDRWQLEVEAIIDNVKTGRIPGAQARLERLLRSMRGAERR